MEKVILTVATTGSGTPIDKYPNLPCKPKDIADEVYKCYKLGAAACHIHAREDDGSRSMNFDRFKETIERIRDKCDIIINTTTSGLEFTEEERMAPLQLHPEMASYNSGSINFGQRVFPNSKAFLEKLALECDKYHVKPEIEAYDTSMVQNALSLRDRGFLRDPMQFQFVLGVDGGLAATPKNLIFMTEMIPAGSTWSVVGVGKNSMMIWSMAMHMGGHIRFGTEDSINIRRGVRCKGSWEFIDQIKQLADLNEREIATVADAKRIWSLD